VGISKDDNDGFHFLTWPPGDWVDEISVYKDDGGDQTGQDVIAHFSISVKVGE